VQAASYSRLAAKERPSRGGRLGLVEAYSNSGGRGVIVSQIWLRWKRRVFGRGECAVRGAQWFSVAPFKNNILKFCGSFPSKFKFKNFLADCCVLLITAHLFFFLERKSK
jgi:hypothetical protein